MVFPRYLKAELVFVFQNTNNYPYQIGDGQLVHKKKPGLAVEMIQIVAKILKIKVNFRRLP